MSNHENSNSASHCQQQEVAVSLVNSRDEAEDEESAIAMARRAKQHKKWNRRLKIFFCCLGYKKNKDSIADVASIFAEFYADLEVPSSDVAAGFVLLSKYQAAQRQWIVENQQFGIKQYCSSIPIDEQTRFLDIQTAEDSHLINELIYYMNYSLAIFGWPMQVVDDPCMLCCICPYLRLSRCCGGNKRGNWPDSNAYTDVRSQMPEVRKATHDSSYKSEGSKDNQGGQANKSCHHQAENSNDNDKTVTTNSDDTRGSLVNNHGAKAITTQPSIDPGPGKPGVLSKDCDGPIILDDNCCGCNAASVQRRLSAHNYEIIYITYKVDVNIVPFLVVADHSKQSLVVAMRGSMSLSDMVTDMNGQADKLPIDNCPDDWLSHRGITRAASYVLATLKDEHILDRAFNCRPDLGSQDYNLILCGHSLGAGVAAILGILMRVQYPSLRAYLYSPPGGILSLPVVEYTKQFATGIILGNDCVPRLGIAQLERLRYHVLLSVKSSKQSTSKILAKAIFPKCCFGGNKVEYDPNQSLNLLHGTEGRSFDYNGNKIPFQVQPQLLYVPGRLIHIVKNYSFKNRTRKFFNEPIYQAIWTENTIYDRLLISEGMLLDHLPNNVMHAMKMLFSKTLPARKDSKTPSLNSSNSSDNNNHHHNHSNLDRKLSNGENDLGNTIVEAVIEKDNNNNNTSINITSDLNNNQSLTSINQVPSHDHNVANNNQENRPGTEALDNVLVDKNGNEEAHSDKNNS